MSHFVSLSRRVGMNDQVARSSVPASPDVVVIGGGLAGLTTAALVARAGKSVVVREKLGALGGDARSVLRDGFTFNQGPHALYRGGPVERVLAAAGVKVRGAQPPVEGKLVFDGRPEIAPAGPLTLLKTKALRPREKLEIGKLLGRLPKIDANAFADRTVNEWIAEVVDEQRSAEMLHAIVRLATYCNQPDVMSAEIAVAQLQTALGPGVLYVHGGWQSLVDQLAATPGVHIVTGAPLDELPDVPAVVIAAGGAAMAEKLTGRSFNVGPPAHAGCLDLGLSRQPAEDLVIGGDVPFYFSNHSAVAELAPAGQFHATAIQYLRAGEDPDADAIKAFTRHAGVRDEDIVVSRQLHCMTPVTAVPTASQGGLAGRPKTTDSGYPNVFLAGDWVGPTGHLADAAVASAEAAANAALAIVDARLAS